MNCTEAAQRQVSAARAASRLGTARAACGEASAGYHCWAAVKHTLCLRRAAMREIEISGLDPSVSMLLVQADFSRHRIDWKLIPICTMKLGLDVIQLR